MRWRVHAKAIGARGAASVATPEAVGHDFAHLPSGKQISLSFEHPTTEITIVAHLKDSEVARAEVLRTARKIMESLVFPAPGA